MSDTDRIIKAIEAVFALIIAIALMMAGVALGMVEEPVIGGWLYLLGAFSFLAAGAFMAKAGSR